MTELSATPGPWEAHVHEDTHTIFITGRCASREVVPWMAFDNSSIPFRKHIANANLIAAAPDLYAALDLAKTTISELYGDLSDPITETDAVLFDVMMVIVAALAKARGEA